ncbi:MAG TPA: TIGR03943 family protein [Phycisphaerae bacterium]|nr:TIGR03943 family protein [Phycisphaerae bacterium]
MSNPNQPPRLSWWELWPMLGWGAFVAYLYAKGRMTLFLRPLYGHLAVGAAAILLLCFVCGWFVRQRSLKREAEHSHDAHVCGAGPSAWFAVRSLMFLVPIVVGLALPERGLNALAALQRGAGDPAMLAELAAQQQLAETHEEQGYGWTTVLGVAQRLRLPEPQKVGALGFVVRQEKMPPDHFLLVRFQITCCAADASPIAVPVHWPQAHTLESNQWVKVFGQTDPEAKVLVADKVEPTREPSNPYM